MMNKCDICLNLKCDKSDPCDCDHCDKVAECPRWLRPTVRITTKCTQSCSHCCFHCSPKKDEMMTIEMAKMVSEFLHSNNITRYINIMGGEFFCNPDWEPIIKELIRGVSTVRIVSNGDWAGNTKVSKKVIRFLHNHDSITMNISRDKFHTNNHNDKAVKMLEKEGLSFVYQHETDDRFVVPVGRACWMYSFFGSLSGRCFGEDERYKFLITENGNIHKCVYGLWKYDNVENYIDGGFRERFKEFGTAFYKGFFGSCRSCDRLHSRLFPPKKTYTLSEFKKKLDAGEIDL